MAIIFPNEYNDKELCDFCKAKEGGNTQTKQGGIIGSAYQGQCVGVPCTEPISLTYQLNKHCKQLPEKVSISDFIKVLDMQEQYREVMEKSRRISKGFSGFTIKISF